MSELCSHFVQGPWTETRRGTVKFYARLALQMFSRYPVTVLNTYSRALNQAVEKEWSSGNYDLLVCDFVQSALLLKGVRATPAVLFQHNVEAQIARRHIEQANNPISKAFWWLQWFKMHAFERAQLMQFDKVIVVSAEDRAQFTELGC